MLIWKQDENLIEMISNNPLLKKCVDYIESKIGVTKLFLDGSDIRKIKYEFEGGQFPVNYITLITFCHSSGYRHSSKIESLNRAFTRLPFAKRDNVKIINTYDENKFVPKVYINPDVPIFLAYANHEDNLYADLLVYLVDLDDPIDSQFPMEYIKERKLSIDEFVYDIYDKSLWVTRAYEESYANKRIVVNHIFGLHDILTVSEDEGEDEKIDFTIVAEREVKSIGVSTSEVERNLLRLGFSEVYINNLKVITGDIPETFPEGTANYDTDLELFYSYNITNITGSLISFLFFHTIALRLINLFYVIPKEKKKILLTEMSLIPLVVYWLTSTTNALDGVESLKEVNRLKKLSLRLLSFYERFEGWLIQAFYKFNISMKCVIDLMNLAYPQTQARGVKRYIYMKYLLELFPYRYINADGSCLDTTLLKQDYGQFLAQLKETTVGPDIEIDYRYLGWRFPNATIRRLRSELDLMRESDLMHHCVGLMASIKSYRERNVAIYHISTDNVESTLSIVPRNGIFTLNQHLGVANNANLPASHREIANEILRMSNTPPAKQRPSSAKYMKDHYTTQRNIYSK